MSVVRIAHLSDPHFGTINPGVEDGLLTSIQEISPSLILLTGDITQRARRSQFRAAKSFTKKLHPLPFIAVPGNHDIPLLNFVGRLFYPYWGFKNLFKDQLEKDFMHNEVQVIGLNSTSRWRHIQGDFNIERIKKRFGKTPPKIKVRIAAFHHPMDCAKYIDEKNLLRGRDETIKIFDQAEVDLVVGGHIHDPFVNLSTERYPKIQKPMILSVAGTCLSWRTRRDAPNSFNLIEIETAAEPHISITRYDIRQNQRFTPQQAHRFKRDNNQGWIRL